MEAFISHKKEMTSNHRTKLSAIPQTSARHKPKPQDHGQEGRVHHITVCVCSPASSIRLYCTVMCANNLTRVITWWWTVC